MKGSLLQACEHYVAREIARGRVTNNNYLRWREETAKALPEARERIKAMDNLELLELIGDVLNNA